MRQHSGDFLICLSKKLPPQNCNAPVKADKLCQARQKAQESLVDCEHFCRSMMQISAFTGDVALWSVAQERYSIALYRFFIL